MFRRYAQGDSAFATGIVHSATINFQMPKVVPNQLKLQRTKSVFKIRDIAFLNARKINQICPALATSASRNLLLPAAFRLFKAVEPVVTCRTGARDV
jgi:hypothetical protein